MKIYQTIPNYSKEDTIERRYMKKCRGHKNYTEAVDNKCNSCGGFVPDNIPCVKNSEHKTWLYKIGHHAIYFACREETTNNNIVAMAANK